MTTARKPRSAGSVAAFAAGPLPLSGARTRWACGDRRHLGLARPPAHQAPLAVSRRAPAAVLGRRVAVATGEYLVSSSAAEVPPRVAVAIERPAADVRVVRACVLVHAPLPVVWGLLSDYGALAEYIPNLAQSDVLSQRRGGARVAQCGVQSILGFTFRASVVMDMREVQRDSLACRAIEFDLVESRDFKEFAGVWKADAVAPNRTALFYTVTVSPRGLVPVRAIEWRIAEDVPGNMDAVKRICEARQRAAAADARRKVRQQSAGE